MFLILVADFDGLSENYSRPVIHRVVERRASKAKAIYVSDRYTNGDSITEVL